MLSDESLTDLEESHFAIYSTKTITNTYYSCLEKLKSDNNASGKRTIVDEKDKQENLPCTSKGTGESHVNLNEPCTSKDTSESNINLNDPCTSRDSSGSSIILVDSNESTVISNEPCTSDETSRSSVILLEENDLEAVPNSPNISTPVVPFTRIRFRRRTGRRRRGRGRGRGTGRGRSATVSGSREQTSEVEVIEVSPVPKRRRTEEIPVIELSDDDERGSANAELSVEDEMNYEVSVKVLWMSVTVKTFRLRRFQKFSSIFEYFMKEENVPYENVLLKLRGIRISNNDTPDSLDLKVCDFIDGGILSEAVRPRKRHEPVKNINIDKDSLIIKLQDKTKIVHRLTINKGEMLKLLMVKYAEQTEIPIKNLKFYYDGDIVNPTDTPDSLGMLNDEIIDVKY